MSTVSEMGKTQTGTVGYTKEYAVIQHEVESFNHPNGGESKFLEKACVQRESANIDRFQQALEGLEN